MLVPVCVKGSQQLTAAPAWALAEWEREKIRGSSEGETRARFPSITFARQSFWLWLASAFDTVVIATIPNRG